VNTAGAEKDKSIQAIEMARQITHNKDFITSQNEALVYINSGNRNLNKNNFEEVIVDFTQAIKMNHNDTDVHFCRDVAYNGIGVISKNLPQLIGQPKISTKR